jgi:hypothetical protein
MANHNTGSQAYAAAQWAASICDDMALETITGEGGWMDEVLVLDGPYIKDGFIQVTGKPGLGMTLNPDVVRAHLATGETWWARRGWPSRPSRRQHRVGDGLQAVPTAGRSEDRDSSGHHVRRG